MIFIVKIIYKLEHIWLRLLSWIQWKYILWHTHTHIHANDIPPSFSANARIVLDAVMGLSNRWILKCHSAPLIIFSTVMPFHRIRREQSSVYLRVHYHFSLSRLITLARNVISIIRTYISFFSFRLKIVIFSLVFVKYKQNKKNGNSFKQTRKSQQKLIHFYASSFFFYYMQALFTLFFHNSNTLFLIVSTLAEFMFFISRIRIPSTMPFVLGALFIFISTVEYNAPPLCVPSRLSFDLFYMSLFMCARLKLNSTPCI